MVSSYLIIVACALLAATYAFPHPDVEIITQPKPGQEYVFVQSTGSGARPIARKDKIIEKERPFETAHKLPPSLTFALNDEEEQEINAKPLKQSKKQKRAATPGEGPAPAPAGAIKLDVQKLLEKYKTELKTTTTAKPKSTSTTTKASRRRPGNKVSKRTKRLAASDSAIAVTSPAPVLTTGAAVPKNVEADLDDVPLVASASEKQRSNIKIKKGPNGQEYEYEYVYYYYDDDDDPKDKKVSNSHDGPARNTITQTPSRGEKTRYTSVEKTSVAPEVNEVVPSSRTKTRGRQLGEEDTVGEERLPANTRFPPRSRNLNTTPLPEEESKATTARGRGRGRPTTEAAPSTAAEADNVSDETQGSRGRTRANVRRPSLELVDSASFNTHNGGAEPPSSRPAFPSDLPAGPDEEPVSTPAEKPREPAPVEEKPENTDSTEIPDDITTVMSPMDKVALDLYAILQGTQKLSGEGAELSTEEDKADETEATTLEITTDPIIPETTTPTTTTTTTTTTTPAPTTTTTTTTEAPLGRGRYRGRGGIGKKTTPHATSTTEAAPEAKPKGKFGRPSFGHRPRPGARTTPEPHVEQDAAKEESKPVSHSRPTLSRGRFGASRPRARTTAAPEESKEESASSTSAPTGHRPSLPRARPTFNRGRTRTTATPTESEAPSDEESAASHEVSSTTAKTRRISAGSGVRPLRPGPRINLSARGRPGAATTTTTEAAVEDHITGDEETGSTETAEKESEAPPTGAGSSPLDRLRNRNRVNVQARPKAAASAPVQVRRVNPLLSRRRPGQVTEATSSEAPQEPSTEAAAEEEAVAETDAPAPSSTTTEEPRGLNKLLAGRRRLAARQPGTTNH